MINVPSEIATRSEGVLERFYAMVVFRLLSGRQIYPIANLAIALRQALLSSVRVRARTHARDLSNETNANEYINNILIFANQARAHTSTSTYAHVYAHTRVV